jgi:hypothetical protein
MLTDAWLENLLKGPTMQNSMHNKLYYEHILSPSYIFLTPKQYGVFMVWLGLMVYCLLHAHFMRVNFGLYF